MRSVVVGTAGHIDHGKSALVRALTGTDPDRLKEEKERGITIDLGFANLREDDVNFAFVDVPGHERFVRNMLAGAGGIDLVMLVIAADESVMPQTREHFHICRMLNVREGIIVLTKSDLADADMRELAALDARELVAGSFLERAPLVSVSARTGEGLDELKRALRDAVARVPSRAHSGAARLPIDRVFSVKGFGTVVTGTLVSGHIDVDTTVRVLPRGQDVKVRGIQVHGESAQGAVAGNRVALNLGGVDVEDLARGDVLVDEGTMEASQRIDVRLDVLAGARAVRHGARVRFHQGTAELLGRVAVVEGVEIAPGASGFARIRLEKPAVVTRGDRFIIRAYSPPDTVGGGVVLDPQAPRGAIRTAAALTRFRAIDATVAPHEAVRAMVAERGAMGLGTLALTSRAGIAPEGCGELMRALGTGVTLVGDTVMSSAVLAGLSEQLLAAIAAHHKTEPLAGGLPREEARERLFARAASGVFEHVVERLLAAGKITARDRLALAGQGVSLTADEARARDAIERVYREAGLAPPDAASAASSAHADASTADRMTKLLLRERKLMKLDTLIFHVDALEQLKGEIRGMKAPAGAGKVDVATFKERYGISRKYAIPLLEYLDRERVTRRVGDARVVL